MSENVAVSADVIEGGPGSILDFSDSDRPDGFGLDLVVAGLKRSRDVTHNIRPAGSLRRPPSRKALARVLDGLVAALFPTHYIDHGSGVVIGETGVIGERVRIYQAVTVGARRFRTPSASTSL